MTHRVILVVLVLALTAAAQQPPPSEPPPRSSDEVSSSRDTAVDISPPAGDRRNIDAIPVGEEESAPDQVEEMRNWNPHKALKSIEIAQYYMTQRNYRAAESRLREALEYKPGDATATFRLAQALEKLGQLPESLYLYEEYERVGAGGKFAAEADAAVKRLRERESMRNYDVNGYRATRMMEVAEGLFRQRAWQAAEERYRHIVELVPTHAQAHARLAEALERQRKYPEARTHYQRYLELMPQGEQSQQARQALARLPKTVPAGQTSVTSPPE